MVHEKMRILLFFPVAPVSSDNLTVHNGGGWIVSFLKEINALSENQVAVAFEGSGEWGYKTADGISLFPMDPFLSKYNKLKRKFSLKLEEEMLLPLMQKAVDDFLPDIIHVFGSENPFGCIAGYKSIPCIIHLQGFLPSYYNAKFPPGTSKIEIALKLLWYPFRLYLFLWMDLIFAHRAKREIKIIRRCNAFFGRTEWDKAIVRLLNPQASYFYCSEILRSEFYNIQGKWQPKVRKKKILISTLSTPLYKGHDLILKTAKLLKEFTDFDFEWKIYGGGDFSFWEKKLKISIKDVHVSSCGVAPAEKLCAELLDADLYIHPSYIDNSPNSVCEAQLTGLPVIAVNAGGVSSIVKDGWSGLLVPANDPLILAEKIKELLTDSATAENVSRNALILAAERHKPETIIRSAMTAYRDLLKSGSVE